MIEKRTSGGNKKYMSIKVSVRTTMSATGKNKIGVLQESSP